MMQLPPDKDGNNPVHFAAKAKNPHSVRILLGDGYDVNAKNKNGRTAMHIACEQGCDEVIAKLARHGADPLLTDNDGNTAWSLVKRIL